MKPLWISLAIASAVLAADKPRPPASAEAGNDNIDISATLFLDPADIHEALGADLEAGYVVARAKALVKTGEPMRLSPDDFVLVSRKNGERADAIAPSQITSSSALTIKRDTRGRDWAHQTNEPGFTGVGTIKKVESSKEDEKLLDVLKLKQFPDKETKTSLEGLVYFSMDVSKLRTKDLALIYKGKGGRLSVEFK